MGNLAMCYETGQGADVRSMQQAIRWYQLAADKGHERAKINLAQIEAEGHRVRPGTSSSRASTRPPSTAKAWSNTGEVES